MSGSSQRHVLVAEDDAAHAEAIRRVFEDSGAFANIRVAGTLGEYRDAVASFPPDIALVDLNLPDGSATEILVSPPEAGSFPVVIMTSHGTEQVAVQAIKAGALDYVVKSPEAFAALPHVVERTLREWKLLKAHRATEAALRESTEIFEQFMEHSPAYVFFKDTNLRAIRLSRNFERLVGKPLSELLGRTTEEMFPAELAKGYIEDDLRALAEGKPVVVEEELHGRRYTTIKFPVYQQGVPRYVAGYLIDVTERRRSEDALREKNAQLEEALAKVRALSGLLPICSGCKKIRDDKGYWSQVESYLQRHSQVTFTHGLCPECIKAYFPGVDPRELDCEHRPSSASQNHT